MTDLSQRIETHTVSQTDDFGWVGLWLGSAIGWLVVLALVQGNALPNAYSPTWLSVGWVVGHVLALMGALALTQKPGQQLANRKDRARTFLLGAVAGIAMGAVAFGLVVAWVWLSPLIPSPFISSPLVPLGS